MNKFIITEEEKDRILDMHKSRTSELYLNEQIGGAGPAPNQKEDIRKARLLWNSLTDDEKRAWSETRKEFPGTKFPILANSLITLPTTSEKNQTYTEGIPGYQHVHSEKIIDTSVSDEEIQEIVNFLNTSGNQSDKNWKVVYDFIKFAEG